MKGITFDMMCFRFSEFTTCSRHSLLFLGFNHKCLNIAIVASVTEVFAWGLFEPMTRRTKYQKQPQHHHNQQAINHTNEHNDHTNEHNMVCDDHTYEQTINYDHSYDHIYARIK